MPALHVYILYDTFMACMHDIFSIKKMLSRQHYYWSNSQSNMLDGMHWESLNLASYIMHVRLMHGYKHA